MSTDIPPDAMNQWRPTIKQNTDTGDWWIEPYPYAHGSEWLKLAEPPPAPKPSSLAERIAEWDDHHGDDEHFVGFYQRMIDDLGLVCRDEVPTETLQPLDNQALLTYPTVTQVMRVLGGRWRQETASWEMPGGRSHGSTVAEALIAIGVRPDQEGE